ncbi:MAG: DUF4340 domain-containing protein [Verrucomicrobiota bacterium]
MKANQLVSYAVVLVVAAILAILFLTVRGRQVDHVGGGSEKNLVLPSFPLNDIDSFSIQTGEESLKLVREGGTWGVIERDGYPADFQKIGELLRSVYQLESVEKVPVGPSKYGRVGLLDPTSEEEGVEPEEKATVLSFMKEGQEHDSLWVGKEFTREERSQFGSFDQAVGRFVKSLKSDDVLLVPEAFSDLGTDPADWLDKEFFQVRKVKSVERIPKEDPAQGWKLVRETDTGDFTLVDPQEGEELDSAKVSAMKNAFSSPSFEDVIIEEGSESPEAVVFQVETFEGFRYEVSVNEKDDANEYLLTVSVSGDLPSEREAGEDESEEDKKKLDEEFEEEKTELTKKLEDEQQLEGYLYRVRGFVADSINKDRSELLAEKEEPEESEAPGVSTDVPGLEGAP